MLLKGDTLEVGDRVSTAANGKVEILLNPGSFLRLGGTSSFEFNTTSLDDLELRLDSGSAILEVFAADEFKVNVKTPSAMYSLVKSGIFRIDIPADKTSTLKVWKGAATVGADNIVKPGRSVTASGTNDVAIAKFDKDGKDALDEWSKSRSKALAQQTASLRRQDIRTPLMQGFLGGRWNFLNSFGLWIYNPFMGGSSFMPFGYGWYSPYGYGYGNGMGWWWEQMHFPTYLPPTSGGGGSSTGTGTGTGTGTSSSTEIRTAESVRNQRLQTPTTSNDRMIPPFVVMEQRNGAGVRGGIGRGDDSSSSGASYSPTYSSSSSSGSPAAAAAPPPASSGGETKSTRSLRP